MCTQLSGKSYMNRGTKNDFTVLKYFVCFMHQNKTRSQQEGRSLVLSSDIKTSVFQFGPQKRQKLSNDAKRPCAYGKAKPNFPGASAPNLERLTTLRERFPMEGY